MSFEQFHSVVGSQQLRGTSKLFRFRNSPFRRGRQNLFSSPAKASASNLLSVPAQTPRPSTPGPRTARTPGGSMASPRHVTLHPKYVCAEEHHYEQALNRRKAHRDQVKQKNPHHFVSQGHSKVSQKKIDFVDPDLLGHESTPTKDEYTMAIIEPLLLDPAGWRPPASRAFTMVPCEVIFKMCHKAIDLFRAEEMCVSIDAPAKVFGDIHGQVEDLLSFFKTYGSPNHRTGDIELVNYVFLGDYVDRGRHNLEVMCLLLALKIRYPDQVYLLRGNHEDSDINANYGFLQECQERLGKETGHTVWRAFNDVFDWMPIAGLIGEAILAVHGGVGGSLKRIDQIRNIARPCHLSSLDRESENIVRDVMWSDPTTSDCMVGVHANDNRGEGLTMFGPDRVKEFCDENQLAMVVRGHECVAGGYELFASGHLVTVFSATNYQGMYTNDGAYLEITSKLKVTPKVVRGGAPAPPPEEVKQAPQRENVETHSKPALKSSSAGTREKVKIYIDGKENSRMVAGAGRHNAKQDQRAFGNPIYSTLSGTHHRQASHSTQRPPVSHSARSFR